VVARRLLQRVRFHGSVDPQRREPQSDVGVNRPLPPFAKPVATAMLWGHQA
jgi:hypothetical protein